MADDWDLDAVVRSCKSATETTNNTAVATTGTTTNTTPTNNPTTKLSSEEEDPFWDWLKFEELTDPLFAFPNLLDPRANAFQELQPFCPNPTTTNDSSTNNYAPIIPNSPIISDFAGSSSYSSGQHHFQQQHHAQLQLQQQQHHFPPATNSPIMRPHFNPSGYGMFHHNQQPLLLPKPEMNQILPRQLQTQQGYMRPPAMMPALPLPRLPYMPTHTPRSRKRKSQQPKDVREVSAEDLSSDMWAWRKYGQKPIKGSLHPRNYYRCSSSKGCGARRQMERSTKDPEMFIVTYSGEHTHPRPTHRNSLSGSTRNKLSATNSQTLPINNDLGPQNVPNPSSPLSAASLSPTAPVEADQDAVANKVNSDNSFDKENDEELDGDEEQRDESENENDEDIDAMSEEILLGMKQLGHASSSGSGGSLNAGVSGDNFSDKGPSSMGSSWAAANHSSAGARVGGGC